MHTFEIKHVGFGDVEYELTYKGESNDDRSFTVVAMTDSVDINHKASVYAEVFLLGMWVIDPNIRRSFQLTNKAEGTYLKDQALGHVVPKEEL